MRAFGNYSEENHFSANENWGEYNKINPALISELNKFRSFLGKPMIVLCGTQGSHCANSYHYQGLAADLCIQRGITLIDLFIAACRFEFYGIGIYHDWRYNNERVIGFHLDIRQLDPLWDGKYRAHWLSTSDKYLPINTENLKKYNLL